MSYIATKIDALPNSKKQALRMRTSRIGYSGRTSKGYLNMEKHGRLVFTRKKGESVTIRLSDGSDVMVYVADRSGSEVKLAFVAPPGVQVDRTEVRESKDRSNANR